MKIKINDYFKNYYLSCGNTRDNFIFENCPKDFITLAQKSLNQNSEKVKSCNILLTTDIENKLNKTLEKFENDFQKKIIANGFFITLFLREIVKEQNYEKEKLNFLENGIAALLTGDIKNVKDYIINSPTPLDIEKTIKEIGKIELNIFLVDTQNIYLQQAVNNYISSRLPYSVKIFTNKQLPTYYDQNGNFIQAPHDYMNVNVYNFIEKPSSDLEK